MRSSFAFCMWLHLCSHQLLIALQAVAQHAVDQVRQLGRHLQSDGHPAVGRQPTLPNNVLATDWIPLDTPQPGNRMVLGLPFLISQPLR